MDSWVYHAVFELSSEGYFEGLLLHTHPYARGDIAEELRAMAKHEAGMRPGTRILYDRLRREFREEIDMVPARPGGEVIRLVGGPRLRSDQFRHGYHKNRAGFDASGAMGVGNTVAVRLRLRVDSDGRPDSTFRGEYWKEHFTAWLDQAVITARLGRVNAAFGREFWRWGRSPVDAMLISAQSPPFDGLRVSYRSDRWAFSFHATVLDSLPMEGSPAARRFLAGHRLDWRPRSNLELAVSEVTLFGGVGRPWALEYLNPFLPYYWEQLNTETNDNPLWNLEVSWRPREGSELYGELLIDDFQIDFTSEPHQVGGLGGAVWTGGPGGRLFVNAEYQRINTFVYGQKLPYNRYYHNRDMNGRLIGIGSNLGPDSDRITIRPRWRQSPTVDFLGLFEHVRRGADRIDSLQTGVVPKGVPFPSGMVERRTTAGAGIQVFLGRWLEGHVLAGYERVTNVENVAGSDRQGLFFRFLANIQFRSTLDM